MKLTVYAKDGKENGSAQMPKQFDEPVRADLIKRAVLSIQSRDRQPYGADPMAGDKHSVDVSRRRRDYRGSYGKGISRVPRKVMSRRGSNFNWVGARAPGTVGGRRAHPPKADKDWTRKINVKENRKAIRSALAATIDKVIVAARGHKIPKTYPFILADNFQDITKTKDLIAALTKIGFEEELDRANKKTHTTGRAKLRGRKIHKISALIVTATIMPVAKAAANITGVQAVTVNELNAELLAPGTHPGRLTLYTESALKTMEEKKLFL